jgi:hypothetical protein
MSPFLLAWEAGRREREKDGGEKRETREKRQGAREKDRGREGRRDLPFPSFLK